MARYNFRSPGGDATNAIEQLLAQRLAEQLEVEQADQRIVSQQESIRQRDDEIRRRTEEDRMGAALRQQQMAQQEEAQKATLMDRADARAMAFMQADAGNMARADQAAASQAAQTERNNADNVAAAERATLMRGVQNSNADLQRELLQGRIDKQNADRAAVQEKTEATQKAQANSRATAISSTQGTLDLINKFLDPGGNLRPEAGWLFGARVPAFLADNLPMGKTSDLSADLNRLASTQIVGLIDEMKRQSATGATGFGALNMRELDVLQNSATTLANRNISDQAAAAELKRIRDKVMEIQSRITGGGQAEMPPPAAAAPTRIRYDMNGNRIP